ncbi:DUF63 family protein [Halovivax cerinus]|uniref:DUF63 family protein n=1 Tax=Halovivax cerinus TaxID=1487865 RepID=A0ABD5NSR2_9EURY|nr:DUF63 family protein [Halovivax cerinus]
MQKYVDRYGAERVWAAMVVTVFGGLALLAALFPHRVYVEFLWEYFWAPVVADANGWSCVAWAGGSVEPCSTAGPGAGPTATPGYTYVSYGGYIPTLLLLLTGFIFAIRRLDVDRYRAGFWGLFPFMLFGGALRTVEDANVAVRAETGEAALSLPWQALLISPFIYVVVAVIALVSLVVAIWLERRDYVPGYEYALAGIGTTLLALSLVVLARWASVGGYGFFPLLAITVLVVASAITAVVWLAIQRFAPELNRGTEYMGIAILWAHTIDGTANVIGLDWATAFGLPGNLNPKHPVNAAIQNIMARYLPESIATVTGDVWPFLLVKVAAAVFIIWVFNEEVFEESPRFTIMLMLTVVAVGLGPGTRDVLRATFGV